MKRFMTFCISVVLGLALTTPALAANPEEEISISFSQPPVYITSNVANDSAPAGTHNVAAAAGRTCTITVTAVNAAGNNPSIRPDTSFVFSSATSVTASGVEATPGATRTTSAITINADGTITATANSGEEGLMSAGFSAVLNCAPAHQPEPSISGYLVCEDENTWRVEELIIEGSYLESNFAIGDVVETSQITVLVTYDDGVYEVATADEVISADSPSCDAVVVTVPPTSAPPTTATPTTAPPATTAPPLETTSTTAPATTNTTQPPVTETTISTTTPPANPPSSSTLPMTGPSQVQAIALVGGGITGGGILLLLISGTGVSLVAYLRSMLE